MLRTIWKYPIPIEDVFSVEMPKDSKILYVDVQRNIPCIWVEVPTEEHQTGMIRRIFYLLGTGQIALDLKGLKHVGSFMMLNGDLVFHLYTPEHLL